MKKEEYLNLVDQITPKTKKTKNCLYAALSGGIIGAGAEILRLFIFNVFNTSEKESFMWVGIVLIITACFLTVMHVFDHMVAKYKAGIIVPTTGFAHSVQSSILDYKKDGMITGMGGNAFKLAGSVILYAVVSAFLLVIVKVIISG